MSSLTHEPGVQEAGAVPLLRTRVTHKTCRVTSQMQAQQAEDMARDPKSWSTCWCMVCGRRLPAEQFLWIDGTQVGS